LEHERATMEGLATKFNVKPDQEELWHSH
jgi:hypothetical protein